MRIQSVQGDITVQKDVEAIRLFLNHLKIQNRYTMLVR